jgi:hypothetical protein
VRPAERAIRHGRHMTRPANTFPSTFTSTTIATAPARTRLRSSPVLAQLDREWALLRHRPAALRTIRRWDDDGPLGHVARSARDLDEIVAASQPGARGGGDSNLIVRRLVELSATDDLAGRILIQRLLPGLISGSKKWGTQATAVEDPIDVVVGAAWIAIRRFDLVHRHTYIAPALVADALWIGFRRGARKMQTMEVPVPSGVLAATPAPPVELEPITALAGTMRAATQAGVRTADLDLLRIIIAAGSPSRAARSCDVSVRTIRNRRDVATAKVRKALGPDWGDWTDPLIAAA